MSDPQWIPYASAAPQASAEAGHLTTLSICHYVWGGLIMLFSSIFIIHIVMGAAMVSGKMPFPTPPANSTQPAFPTQIGYVFICMGSGAVGLGWTVGILSIISGRCIARRRRRIFSLVMAGVNCVSFPLGTTLGVFTFIVLLRPSVRGMYPT
jgi:hypothetical protein